MAEILKHYINGTWVASHGTTLLEVDNPATTEVLAKVPLGDRKDVEAAVGAAQEAFRDWRETPPLDRAQYFFKLKTLLEEHFEDLSRMVTVEHGKTLHEARGDVRRGIQNVEVAAGIPTLLMGETCEDVSRGVDSTSMRRALGVFAAITPFNFPAMVPLWFWPFAVACGNTYVVKPSEQVPLTQQLLFQLTERVGFPKGVLNLVHGAKEVVDALCDHPDVKGVSFVGSTPVAEHIYRRCAAAGKRVQALGGAKNSMIVMDDAVKDKTVANILDSSMGCAGQRCLAASVVLCVGDHAYDWFSAGFVEQARKVKTGNGLDENVNLGPVISRAAKDRILTDIGTALEQGATMLLDGRNTADLGPGYFLRPTVLATQDRENILITKELFGPVVALLKVSSLQEGIDLINACPFANTTSIFTSSGRAARQFQYEVHPSMIGVNIGVPAPMSFFSFGGTRKSLYGDLKAHGKESIAFFTDTKVSIIRWF
ncbi:MAG: methylmalonate-semialdehyde dehydrogenase (acylating) [Deltaproteobacteria bacterium RIFOXYA12_FULL_61_11]|nr:MAG: methylmalonate-semialdehyde dehydrogenase (acylating) [Deltaproteobacteria bacterium RIFOXYA12_FULL_61_11]